MSSDYSTFDELSNDTSPKSLRRFVVAQRIEVRYDSATAVPGRVTKKARGLAGARIFVFGLVGVKDCAEVRWSHFVEIRLQCRVRVRNVRRYRRFRFFAFCEFFAGATITIK